MINHARLSVLSVVMMMLCIITAQPIAIRAQAPPAKTHP